MSCVCRKIVTCSVSPEVSEAVKQKIQAALMPFGQECLEKVDVQKNENTPKTRKKFRFADEDYEELEQVKFFDGDNQQRIPGEEMTYQSIKGKQRNWNNGYHQPGDSALNERQNRCQEKCCESDRIQNNSFPVQSTKTPKPSPCQRKTCRDHT